MIIIAIVILALVIPLAKCVSDKYADANSDGGENQEESYDGKDLEIIEDDGTSEQGVDTSEYWEDTDQTGESKTEETQSGDGVSDKKTLEDGQSWGNIY